MKHLLHSLLIPNAEASTSIAKLIMNHLHRCLLILLCLSSLSLQAADGTQREHPGRSPSFIPLGVYWAGSCMWRDVHHAIDWVKVDTSLKDLAQHHVNAIWITHLSAGDTAEFSRRAALHGISLVASIAEMDFSEPYVRGQDHQKLIQGVLQSWGDAPKPIAWGLGDEPRAAYMTEMAAYVKAWRTHAPGEPLTTVVMWTDITAAGTVGFDQLATDVYPFFSEGNPNRYPMAQAQAWIFHVRKMASLGPRPWMMGQSFQEPVGPFKTNSSGHVVYLPGGAAQWVTPTPEQIRWQALSAMALASKGMFYFHYRAPAAENLLAEAANLPATVKVITDSGSPIAMVLPDGGTTPQYEAMGEVFSWLSKHQAALAPLVSTPIKEAWEPVVSPENGNVVNMLMDPVSKERWLMIVAGYQQQKNTPVRFVVGPHITGLTEHLTGSQIELTQEKLFRSGMVQLAPGTAILLKCRVDAARLPLSYDDNFLTDRYQTDAVTSERVRRFGDGILSADRADLHAEGFVIYDLERWFPRASAGSLSVLRYDGVAAGGGQHGAFWYTSPDAVTWRALSSNEFDQPRQCPDRYLKVRLTWWQTNSPQEYGCLTNFSVIHWPAP